jgi:hypothetical protein
VTSRMPTDFFNSTRIASMKSTKIFRYFHASSI